jgi:hypothetical protein
MNGSGMNFVRTSESSACGYRMQYINIKLNVAYSQTIKTYMGDGIYIMYCILGKLLHEPYYEA